MKRLLIGLLLIIVAAGYLGTLIARDPGYVLITYQSYSLQSSLWVMLCLLVLFVAFIYYALRLLGLLTKSSTLVRDWRARRRELKVAAHSHKGLQLLAEGEYNRAQKFLNSGADNQSTRGINYLAAARAADDTGDNEARETYLRLAEESDHTLTRARCIVSAELALRREDYQTALSALDGVKLNPHVAGLVQQALEGLADWREMLRRSGELRKAGAGEGLERAAALLGIAHWSGDNSALNELFRSLDGSTKQDPAVVAAYAQALSDQSHAEPVLRAAIKHSWEPSLVALYGQTDQATLKVRLKHVKSWLQQHADDPALQYALGCLFASDGEPVAAKAALVRSLELGFVDARVPLAALYADGGEYDKAYTTLSAV